MIVGEGALVSCMDGSLCPVDLLTAGCCVSLGEVDVPWG